MSVKDLGGISGRSAWGFHRAIGGGKWENWAGDRMEGR
jgi:hypothetical protein